MAKVKEIALVIFAILLSLDQRGEINPVSGFIELIPVNRKVFFQRREFFSAPIVWSSSSRPSTRKTDQQQMGGGLTGKALELGSVE